MIRTFTRPSDEHDLRAMAPPGTSFALNLLRGSLPVSVVAFAIVYLLSRSLLIAGMLGLALFAASVVSNVRFFGEVERRSGQKTDPRAVEVIEVEATRVWDIEPLGDNAPAYVFFANDRKALL